MMKPREHTRMRKCFFLKLLIKLLLASIICMSLSICGNSSIFGTLDNPVDPSSSTYKNNSTFTISYNANSANGGTAPVDIKTYQQGENVTILGNTGALTRTNYSFVGWNLNSAGTGTIYTAGSTLIMGSANVILYANWASIVAGTYTVTFDSQGGSSITAIPNITSGSTITLPSAPTKSGFTFSGWYTATNGGGTQFTASSTVISNMTIYANWTAVVAGTNTVTFDSQGGTTINSITNIASGATITLPTTPTKSGSIFSGWYTAVNGGGTQFSSTSIVTTNITLYAKWTTNPTYSVTYSSSVGTGSVPIDSQTYAQGANVTVLGTGTLVNNGYQLAGWMTKSDGTGTSYAFGATFAIGANNQTLFAVWISSNYTYTSNGNNITISGYVLAPNGQISIPNGVTAIGQSAFSNCSGLTAVTIPSSITSIGQSGFSGCPNLTSITIPSSVTTIGQSAFQSCYNLSSLTIQNGVTSIGQSAFQSCSALTSVILPASLTSIGSSIFQACSSLTNIIIPSGVSSISDEAFYLCSGLNSVTIPIGVTHIGNSTFNGCTSLASITIPSSVSSIDVWAFVGCTALTSITIPSGVTSIGWNTFNGCTSLTNISIPASVTTIGDNAFQACSSLTSIAIPSGVTTIGMYTFNSCTKLTNVTFSSNLTTIGTNTFESCTSLTSISIPQGVTKLADYLFHNCTLLNNVTIPSSITSIGSNAFDSCSSLSTISIPPNVTSIRSAVFYNCTALSTINILATIVPSLQVMMGSGPFDNCAPNLLIHVPSGTLNVYKATTGWSSYASILISP